MLIGLPVMVIYLTPVTIRVPGEERVRFLVQILDKHPERFRSAEDFSQWQLGHAFVAFRVLPGFLGVSATGASAGA